MTHEASAFSTLIPFLETASDDVQFHKENLLFLQSDQPLTVKSHLTSSKLCLFGETFSGLIRSALESITENILISPSKVTIHDDIIVIKFPLLCTCTVSIVTLIAG